MYLLILLLPLIHSIFVALLSNKLGPLGLVLSVKSFAFYFLILSLLIYYEVVLQKSICFLYLFNWCSFDYLSINWYFLFDYVSVSMLLLVSIISSIVHFYSVIYMQNEPFKTKFISLLSLFTFFMLMLILSGNFIQLFLGWEGVGVTSYLLINYWHNRISANKSSLKALLINKIGDIFLLLGILLISHEYLSFDFSLISNLNYLLFDQYIYILNYPFNFINLCCILILVGVTGKSAQFGLHTWLPDAMEGPTPVSALLHAATMVTAGIFLMIKCSCFYEYTNMLLYLIIFIGSITSFFSATAGLFQNDIKKIIAYSTCSQLGYMLISSGFSHYSISLFHLLNHGFFKALLFLGSGIIIHFFINDQDARVMGGFSEFYISLYLILLVGTFSLCGFPFFSGFFSKDVILETSNLIYSITGNFVKFLQYTAAFFTCLYGLRNNNLVFFVLFNSSYSTFLWLDSHFFWKASYFHAKVLANHPLRSLVDKWIEDQTNFKHSKLRFFKRNLKSKARTEIMPAFDVYFPFTFVYFVWKNHQHLVNTYPFVLVFDRYLHTFQTLEEVLYNWGCIGTTHQLLNSFTRFIPYYIPHSINQNRFDFDELIFFFLFFCSFLSGYVLLSVFIFLGLDIFTDSIDFFSFFYFIFNLEYINTYVKLLPLLYLYFSFFLVSFTINLYDLYFNFLVINFILNRLQHFLFFRWYVDISYTKLLVNSFLLSLSLLFSFLIEQLFFDSFCHFGVFSFFSKVSHFIFYTKYIHVYHNIHIYICTLILYLFYFFFFFLNVYFLNPCIYLILFSVYITLFVT